jgi:hypothetical protein
MHAPIRVVGLIACAVLIGVAASPAAADLEDYLGKYTGENGEGYLQPLVDAIGADLNSGIFRSGYVAPDGFHLSLETPIAAAFFGDDDRVFMAAPSEGFDPDDPVEAPTAVGQTEYVYVDGINDTRDGFPGGLDLSSFALAAPQIRVGSVMGTEAILRYLAIDVGDSDIGKINLFGMGLKHSISQYIDEPPWGMDMSAGFFWQNITIGDELMDATAFTAGVQASKRYVAGFATAEPYVGLGFDTFSMDVSYEDDEGTDIDLSFESETSFRGTMGLNLSAAFFTLYGEYSIANVNTFGFGLGLGF